VSWVGGGREGGWRPREEKQKGQKLGEVEMSEWKGRNEGWREGWMGEEDNCV